MEQANSISAYIKILERYQNGSEQYFRGQLEKYTSMPPSIARDNGYAMHECMIYHEAVSMAKDELRELTSPLELLSKLQHYGIPTRLIDLTIDPLIALYFAVEDDDDFSPGNVYLYQTNGYSANSKQVRVLSLLPTIEKLTIDKIAYEYEKQFGGSIDRGDILRYVASPVIMQHSDHLQKLNPRLYNQKGTFLLCGNEVCNDTITGVFKSLDTYTPTIVIRIPFEYKKAVKEELDNKYKINRTSVYPELPSIAQYIREKYKEKNFNIDRTFSIVKEEDVSTGVAKRISVTIVLKEQLTIDQIKNISIRVMQSYQGSHNAVWLYVARTGDDYITYNWILCSQWIDQKLNPKFRPVTLGTYENGYYWDYSKSYSTMADYYVSNIFDVDSKLYIDYKRVWDQFFPIYLHLSESFRDFPWDIFAEEVRKVKKQVRDLYMQLQDFGHSHDKKFDDFLSAIPAAVCIVDNFHLWIENEKASTKAVQYIMSKRFSEVSDRADQVNETV